MQNYESDEALNKRHELLMCLQECWYAAFQSKRFLNAFEALYSGFENTTHDIAYDVKNNILRLDAFYAISSLSMTGKYLNINRRSFPALDGIIDELNQNENWKRIKDARDILTHKDEYAAGGGRHREKYFQSANGIGATMDSVIVLIDQRQYLIGATLDLVNACEHYLAVYSRIYDLISAQIGYRDMRYDFSILTFH